MRKAYLLINLGTPDNPSPGAVRRYLKEFLMDEEVIDIPLLVRAILVYGIIAPFRSPKSAAAYQTIWTGEGSPLITHSFDFMDKLKAKDENADCIFFACRYGNPSMVSVLEDIKAKGFGELHIFPLYPQYATSTWLSVEKKLRSDCRKLNWRPILTIQSPYCEDGRYIHSLAETAAPYLEEKDHLLFSFHGIPVRQCSKPMPEGSCQFTDQCCLKQSHALNRCYRSHCTRTANAVARQLKIKPNRWSMSFQSRLGRAKWLEPYTVNHIENLLSKGVENLAVTCPAFVVDCLETLEEINMGIREKFLEMGGKTFKMIPCLNASPVWIESANEIMKDQSYHQPFSLQP